MRIAVGHCAYLSIDTSYSCNITKITQLTIVTEELNEIPFRLRFTISEYRGKYVHLPAYSARNYISCLRR